MDYSQQEQLRAQQARRQAEEAIRELANMAHNAAGGTYLVSDFRRRDDLPLTASLRRMTNTVAKKLAEQDLKEPVSLRSMPDRWWKVRIDAAEVGLVCDYGCAVVTRMLSTAQLMEMGFEVEDGPFQDWENDEVSRAILKQHPSKFWDARIYQVGIKPKGLGDPHVSGADNAFASEALIDTLDQGDSIQVFSGPYETGDNAHYALDVRREVPE